MNESNNGADALMDLVILSDFRGTLVPRCVSLSLFLSFSYSLPVTLTISLPLYPFRRFSCWFLFIDFRSSPHSSKLCLLPLVNPKISSRILLSVFLHQLPNRSPSTSTPFGRYKDCFRLVRPAIDRLRLQKSGSCSKFDRNFGTRHLVASDQDCRL